MPDREHAPADCDVREANADDIPALASIRHNEAVHRDRIRDADSHTLRYLVIEAQGRIAGFGCLVLAQPQNWPPFKSDEHLPQMIDLFIREDLRYRGLGTRLIREMERLAREAGYAEMHLQVDPKNNPLALKLYGRLGYTAIETTPVERPWDFVDSDGVRHVGTEWTIYVKKALT